MNALKTKASVFASYLGGSGPVTTTFLALRTAMMPLEAFSERTPRQGTIIEIGSGHGLIAQYLARREPLRRVVAYDPDSRRVAVARKAATGVSNIEYRDAFFDSSSEGDVAAVVIVGVLCLIDDPGIAAILSACRKSLPPGAPLVFSDILKDPRDWRYRLNIWREHAFAKVGFVKSEGLFPRDETEWKRLLQAAGFETFESFRAPVVAHPVFNWVCR